MASEPATRDRPVVARFDDLHMVFASGASRPVHALDGFSMEIEEGSVVGLLGPNGSGKTTAISCLLALLRPQGGAVHLWGTPVGIDLPPGPRRRIGVLLEDTRLPPFLSVRAALTAVCGIRGLRGRERSAELDRVVAQARVEELLEQRVAVLSKGQARRVGLAATLVGDPPLLILDEPSAGLDVTARVEFNELVRELADDSRTILIASHLLSDIERTCTHVAIVQAGRIRIHERAELLLREARERQGEKDFHVDATWSEELARLEIRHEPSRYPGQVLLVVEEPEHELLGRLAAHRIVPSRIEPRADLVSIYLEVTGEGSE